MDQFIMNNCKIANELRKYRDLAGAINRVTLSERKDNYAEYIITQDLTYLDMVTANAVYSLWRGGRGENGFGAEAVGQIMAGRMDRRLRPEKQAQVEARLQKLARTQLYILADHDSQAQQELYEGDFLPLTWESAGTRLSFRFRPRQTMPLYQYAEERGQLIKVPFSRLRDDGAGQTRLNNNDQTLLLRHYLLQELEIVLYPDNRVEEREIRLLKRDGEGREYGLLWVLGLAGQEPNQTAAKRVQRIVEQLMDNCRKNGYVTQDQYQLLPAEQGYGVRLFSRDKEKRK